MPDGPMKPRNRGNDRVRGGIDHRHVVGIAVRDIDPVAIGSDDEVQRILSDRNLRAGIERRRVIDIDRVGQAARDVEPRAVGRDRDAGRFAADVDGGHHRPADGIDNRQVAVPDARDVEAGAVWRDRQGQRALGHVDRRAIDLLIVGIDDGDGVAAVVGDIGEPAVGRDDNARRFDRRPGYRRQRYRRPRR